MNKAELIATIVAKTGETKKSAEATVNAFIDAVSEALVKGEKVQLVGFGSFEVRKRAARKGRNPRTKEEIKIPASKAPVFKAGKALKDLSLIHILREEQKWQKFIWQEILEMELHLKWIIQFIKW